MTQYRLIGTVTVVVPHDNKDQLMLDYNALQMRFNHVKANMLNKGGDITMNIKVEKVEQNG
jgi:hypothetical protein